MLLAVAMVMSLAPASVLVSAFNISVDGTDSSETVTTAGYIKTEGAAVSYDIDTTGTSEVIRIAANSSNSCDYGTTIVPEATPSGMPKITSGTFKNVAYAGETPQPTVVKINFKNGVTPDEAPSLTSSLGNGMSLSNAVKTTVGTTTTYTWTISGGTATVGTGVLYTINYKIAGINYVSYASAHVENILRPNGTLSVAYRRKYDREDVKTYVTRVSALLLFQGKNVYSGWAASGGSDRGYVNYGSGNSLDGGAIAGCGSDGYKSASQGGYAISDNTNGTIVRAYSGAKKTSANYQFGYSYDKNRPLSNVYLDAAEGETISSLNIRSTYQNGESSNCNYATLIGVGVWASTSIPEFDSDNEINSFPTGDGVLSVATPISHCQTNGDGVYFVPSNVTSTGDDNHAVIHFTGSGNSSTVYTVGMKSRGQLDASSQENRWVQVSTATCSFKFNYYDSSALRTTLNAVRLNTGVNYNGTTYYNGQYPAARYYTAGWDNFIAAYANALHTISAPDIYNGAYASKQDEINGVNDALKAAYAGLQGYRSAVNYTVNYTNVDSNVALLPSRTGTVNVGETLKTGAPTIDGYVCQEAVQNTSNFIDGTTDITIAYTYMPAEKQIVIFTNNDLNDMPSIPCYYGYTLPFSTMEANLGTKAYYTFAGWYYDEGFTNPIPSTAKMPASTLSVYAKWTPTPLTITLDPQISGKSPYSIGSVTPDPNGPVYFNRPADPSIEGYVFVNFYADAALETLVEWPMEFNLGDSNKTIYARFEDVNGKISFESMGGTKVNTINYTSGTPISQPTAPTRQGYDFAGWFFDREYTQPVTGWTNASYDSTTGAIIGSAPASGTYTRNTMTGFVAYARWTPQTHTISFQTGINYDAEPSKFNTRNYNLSSLSGLSDSTISQEDLDLVVIPTRFGYEFSNWSYNGQRYDLKKYPTQDITLTAEWRPVDYSAFIDVLAYKMLNGKAVSVNENDYGTGEGLLPVEDKPDVMKGDVITFRMSSKTNFYTGSSLFVFMYDKNFYDLVGTGTSAFKLNPDNDYIKGLGVLDATPATYTVNTNIPSSRWPEGLDQTKYTAMQIAIDPNVTATNYDTEPMADETWILEFKLRIKDDATGSGEVFMDNAWTRSADNPMGTMFYGWTSSKDSVMNTTNNVVMPDLQYAHSVVTVGDGIPVYRTVNISAVNGDLAGQFSDGSTTKTYTGRASTEILDYVGTPTLYGYHLDEGEEFVDGSGNFWIEGYYPTEEQGETPMSYNANWKVNTWSAKFYGVRDDSSSNNLKATLTTSYNQIITGASALTLPAKKGYTFGGWLDENNQDVDFTTYLAPNNDVVFYAKWIPSLNSYTINYMYGDTLVKAVTTSNTAYTEDTVMIVNEIPATPADHTVYVLASDLKPGVNGYGYDPDANVLPISAVVGVNGATLTVQCKKVPLNDTFNTGASGVVFESTGAATRTYSGLEGSTYAENGITADNIEIPTRTGYTFTGYTTGSGASAVTWTPDVIFSGRTWRAGWQIKSFVVKFVNETGLETYKQGNVNFNAAITPPTAPTKTGYTFKGWKLGMDADDSTAATSLGKLETEGDRTYYAVFEINKYNVSYTLNGAAYGEGATFDYGSTHNYAAAPTAPTGYEFDGWYFPDDATAHTASETYTVPGNDIVITGSYVAKQYNVKFDANKGKFGTETFVNVPTYFDANITTPENNPTKSGYQFAGWSLTDTNDVATVITDFGTLTTEGKTYYAVWTASTTNYYVDIYYMGLNGTYSTTADSTVTLEGTVDTTCDTYVPAAAATGFAIDDVNCVFSGAIPAPDEGTLRLVVKYSRNQHDVYTKNEESATPVKVATYYYGAAIATPTDPDASVKPGYTFNGWSWSGSHETMPDIDVTATATWVINKYPVKFYLTQADYNASATPVNSSNVDYQSVISPASASREGYSFVGWARPGSTETVTFDENLKVALGGDTFVGIWTINQYPLIYKSNGATVKTYMVDYGTPAAEFPVPSDPAPREGYEFKGWNAVTVETMPANESGVVILAKWEMESYTIIFDVAGGTPSYDSVTASAGEDISGLIPQSNPTKTGYTFNGWDDEIPTEMPDLGDNGAEKTITAQWNINSYTIYYKGFNNADLGSITKNYNEAIAASETPTAPEVEGYYFVEWSEATPETMPALGANGASMTITANYAKETFTINLSAGDGEFSDGSKTYVITKEYGEAITAPANPTRRGYTFDEWSESIPTTMPDLGASGAEKTITAKWNINSYTIYYKGFNNADLGSITKNYDEAIATSEIPEIPAVEGYRSTGWNSQTPEKMPYLGENGSTKTITAEYVKESYTIIFNAGNGIFPDGNKTVSITKEYGENIFAPEQNPTWTGHTFKNWSEEIPSTMPDLGDNLAEKTIVAVWDVNDYVIYFDANNGEFSEGVTEAQSTFAYGADTAAYATEPTRTGYTFEYWYETDETVEYVFGTMPAENVNLKAYWVINQYKISFDSDGGNDIDPITADFGATVSAPANPPIKEGYTFKYWYEGTDSSVRYNFFTMPANDVSLKAFYEVNSYSVKFYDGEGTVISDTKYDFGTSISEIVLPIEEANPEKAYYTFEGWTIKIEGSCYKEDAVDFENSTATVGTAGYDFYPIFVKIPVELVVSEESSAIIVPETLPTRGIIYGLETKLSEEKLLEEYISFTGSGEIVVTPSLKGNSFSVCGTGTTVDLYDTETGNLVASYFLVIIGDINGDGISTSVDVSLAKAEAAREQKTWSAADSEANFKMKAIDVDKDGAISADEITALSKVALAKYDYVQTDGTTIEHKKS